MFKLFVSSVSKIKFRIKKIIDAFSARNSQENMMSFSLNFKKVDRCAVVRYQKRGC